ncbi:MAG TPA: DUF3048 domain-containing protein [Anaerolineaceae bacterium]
MGIRNCFILFLSFLLCLILTSCQAFPAAAPVQAALPSTPQPVTPTSPQYRSSTPSLSPYPTSTQHRTSTPIPTITPFYYRSPTAVPIRIIPTQTSMPANINPFTGRVVSNLSLLERRPVMVKVSNYPASGRPHAGLSFADLVFESYIGYGENRFNAIYYGQDSPKSGPVRSGRLVDAQLGLMYQTIFLYANADEKVEEKIAAALGERALASKNMPCEPVCYNGTQSITTLFTDTARLSEYAKDKGIDNSRQNLQGMAFSIQPPASSTYAVNVAINFSSTDRGEWRYDTATQTYLRWIESVANNGSVSMIPLVDRLTEKQLSFANVLVVFARYIEYSPTLHDIDLANSVGNKRMVLFRDGIMVDGFWKANAPDLPLQFITRDGNPMPLKPGNSWIVLVGEVSTLTEQQPGQWQIQFALP